MWRLRFLVVFATILVSVPSSAGSHLTGGDITAQVSDHVPQLEACYDAGGRVDGTVVVHLQIGKDGNPSGVVAVAGSLAGTPEGNCVIDVVKTMVWRKTDTAVTIDTTVSLPPE